MHEPIELQYIEPFFQSMNPRAVPVVGRTHLYRLTLSDKKWHNDIGLVVNSKVDRLKMSAKYRIFKLMDKRGLITFCSSCFTILGSSLIDGYDRPWENICEKCISSDDKQFFPDILRT